MPTVTTRVAQTFKKPNIAESYGTFASRQAAMTYVENADIKCAGLTVGIDQEDGSVKEYWLQPVEGQLQFVEKGGASGNFVTEQELQQGLSGKQDTINDLSDIRSGASAGATAVQPSTLNGYVQKSQTTGLLKNDGTIDTETAGKAASALQPKQSGQYTQGDIVIFDVNGGLTDSQKKTTDFATAEQGAKADTAVQQVAVDPDTVTGNAGTNASVANIGTQTAPVLKFTIPRGTDAVNPFKGWWPDLATLKAAHTATAGDSAYVKDASPATTWSIYIYDSTASSDNYWADSGLDADTSHTQTFASGEEVNLTPIDETHLSNPTQNSLARALDVVGKLNMLGVTTTAKDLIISLFRKCAYTSQDAENIIANLEAEFEGDRVLMGITAELPTSYTFYDNQSLEDLRSILVVTANYDDGSTVSVTTYTLQGNITAGTSVITVSYGGMSTTVEVTVTHIIELTFSNSDFLKKCAADNRYDSVFDGVHYCLSSDVRCAYALFDKMLTGGKSYRLSLSSSDSRTKVGVQAFTDSTLAKVANNEDWLAAGPGAPTIDAWDSGWTSFTDGVAIVTIPEKATSDSLSTIRGVRLSIKIDNGSAYGLVIPTNYQISLTITEIPD